MIRNKDTNLYQRQPCDRQTPRAAVSEEILARRASIGRKVSVSCATGCLRRWEVWQMLLPGAGGQAQGEVKSSFITASSRVQNWGWGNPGNGVLRTGIMELLQFITGPSLMW